MKVHISEELKQSFLEIKKKKIISIQELNNLQTRIFKEKIWIVYGDYLMNFLIFFGIFLVINYLNIKLDFNFNIFILLIIAEVFFQICKFAMNISHLNHLHKLLRSDGIEVAEIKILKQIIFSQGFVAYNILRLTNFLYSQKTQKEVFQSIASDWQEEYFEALFKKEIWKARLINVRYTYAFLGAIWQKSPLGDLLEFIRKFAK